MHLFKNIVIRALIIVAVSAGLFSAYASHASAAYYFAGGDFNNSSNWFNDQALSDPANTVPSSGDDIIVYNPITSAPGSISLNSATFYNDSAPGSGVYITVSDTATFNDSSNGDNILGNAIFNGTSVNNGSVNGSASFNGSYSGLNWLGMVGTPVVLSSDAIITLSGSEVWTIDTFSWQDGGSTWRFNDSSRNTAYVSGNAVYNDSSVNQSSIKGTAAFNDSSYNSAGSTVGSDATFNDSSRNDGIVQAMATFNGSSSNANGSVGSDAAFNGNFIGSSWYGTVGGSITLGSNSTITTENSDAWTTDISSWTDNGAMWIFEDTSSNQAIVHEATFNDSSSNVSTVTGDAVFNDSSSNNTGTVEGDAEFHDSSTNIGPVNGDASYYDSSVSAGTNNGDAFFYGDLSEVTEGITVGEKTRIYESDIAVARDFVSDGPWTILADGAVVNLYDSLIDPVFSNPTYTTLDTANGGSFDFDQPADVTAPTISNVTSGHANGTFGIGETISVQVTFSEAVTSSGNITLTFETGATDRTCTFAIVANAIGGCNYVVQAGDITSDLTVSSISGTIEDASGNDLVNFAPATNLAANKNIAIDTAVPVISAVASSTSPTTATITWTTNEAASSTVDYGLTASYTNSSSSAALVTSHSITLRGLTASTAYHFRVKGADAVGNVSSSSDLVFTTTATPDTTAPIISSVVAISSLDTISITFDTNEAATSSVSYGLTAAYGSATTSNTLLTSHTLVIRGLASCTTYHYRIAATDGSSNTSTTTDDTLSTVCPSPDIQEDEDDGRSGRSSGGSSHRKSDDKDESEDEEESAAAIPADAGCSAGNLFSTATGKKCSAPAVVSCLPGQAFNTETGKACSLALPVFVRDLTVGSIGEDVRQLQLYLNAKGFIVSAAGAGSPGFETPMFGAFTRAALSRFQAANGIVPAAGYFGPLTRQFIQLHI